jgi:hypothetical protein
VPVDLLDSEKVKTAIFLKTCLHDAEYHRYCLKSIEKFCTGFSEVRVIEGEHPKGYLWQQVVKLHADQYTDADFILVTDSDTLFVEPVTPESFMREGKPQWLYTPWNDAMLQHAGTRAWKDCMEKFLGLPSPGEMMRRQPFMFPRHVLPSIREFCLKKHGKSLEDYIMNAGSFSEWNCLGLYCWLGFHNEFDWINTDVDPLPPLRVNQMWSHAPIEQNLEEINRILA